MDIWLKALALMMVFEGAMYGFFPEGTQKVMREVITFPPHLLRVAGLVLASLGAFWLWWMT
jgi:uncharacterized protein YjeT (DUF2065 family)